MSLHPQEPPSVPEETIRVARAAFPKGSPCLCIADELGSIYTNDQFTALFPRRGKHAPKLRGGSLSRRCCNSWRACPTDRPRMPYADGSTGNTHWVCH